MRKLSFGFLAVSMLTFALPGWSLAGSPGGPYTTSAISVSPNPTNPGATATVTSTHQILGLPPDGDRIELLIFLSGTNGNGTLGIGTSSNGGTCTLDAGTNRQWKCIFAPGSLSVGDTVTLTAPVNVSAATPTPDTFSLLSEGRVLRSTGRNDPDSLADTELAIEAVQQSTTTTIPDQSTTAAPTDPPASTEVATTSERPTTTKVYYPPPSPPPGSLPATGGGDSAGPLLSIGALAVALGAIAVVIARRRTAV